MRTIERTLTYLPLDTLLRFIDPPHRALCQRLLADHRKLFEKAPGATHNHQAWPGGYIDHVTDGMNYARHLYAFDQAFGRPLSFSLSDGLLVYFLHDLEKPWRIQVDAEGRVSNRDGLSSKAEFKRFRDDKLAEYGFFLTEEQRNGLAYVEGEHADYSSQRRAMNGLAAFCHKVDVWCAREWYDYPKADGDEWTGAKRFRSAP